ncbi:MAG TPA: ABC transporter permease [Balneolaceae bacterium]|nr:ABC transporter permease [Balneolaceae bacterium]
MFLIPNFLKVALRNIRRNRMYSFINIAGLAIGIACTILILLYIYDEYSYDRFHKKADRIYRLNVDAKTPAEVTKLTCSPGPMGPNLVRDFPQVESMVRIMRTSGTVAYKQSRYQVDHALYADSTFYNIFSFKLLKGNPDNVLAGPASVVLTEDLAKKIFGDKDPIGKTIQLVHRGMPVTVTGVAENTPRNSHFTFDMIFSMGIWDNYNNLLHDGYRDWFRANRWTYLLLNESSDPAMLETRFPDFLDSHIGKAMKQKGESYKLSLIPLTNIYLYSHRKSEIAPTSNGELLYILGAIAFFILLIACINFMNLATARSLRRAKEVGIRKVIGTNRLQVAGQFMDESMLLSFLALIIAYTVCYLLFPLFNEFAGKHISTDLFINGRFIAIFIGFGIFTGFIAGLYPAFVLSRFKPAKVMGGDYANSSGGQRLRKGLIIFQFIIAILLISGSAVVYKQLAYTSNRNLGYDKENMLLLQFNDYEKFQEKYKTIKQAFE